MLRSAAKNHDSVTVVVDPSDYAEVARQISDGRQHVRWNCAASLRPRSSPARRPMTPPSPRICKRSLPPTRTPCRWSLPCPRRGRSRCATAKTRIKRAALYGKFHDYFKQLHGKELSYNNILDLTAAAALIAEFRDDAPTLAILKHTNPCGVGQGGSLREAWDKAFATDKQAPFGGIIAVQSSARRRLRGGHRRDFQRGHRRAGVQPRRRWRSCRKRKTCGCCKC